MVLLHHKRSLFSNSGVTVLESADKLCPAVLENVPMNHSGVHGDHRGHVGLQSVISV